LYRTMTVMAVCLALCWPAFAQVEKGDSELSASLSYDRSTQTLEMSSGDFETKVRNTIFSGAYGHFVSDRAEVGGSLTMVNVSSKAEGESKFTGMGFGYLAGFYNYHIPLKDPTQLLYFGGELVKGFFLGWDEDAMGVPAPSMIGIGLTFGGKKFISEDTFIGLQDNLRIQSYSIETGFGDASVKLVSIIFAINVGIIF